MSKKAIRPQRARHILVYDEDWEFLLQAYGPESQQRFGVGPAVREIVHGKVTQLREQLNQKISARKQVEQGKAELVEQIAKAGPEVIYTAPGQSSELLAQIQAQDQLV